MLLLSLETVSLQTTLVRENAILHNDNHQRVDILLGSNALTRSAELALGLES